MSPLFLVEYLCITLERDREDTILLGVVSCDPN